MFTNAQTPCAQKGESCLALLEDVTGFVVNEKIIHDTFLCGLVAKVVRSLFIREYSREISTSSHKYVKSTNLTYATKFSFCNWICFWLLLSFLKEVSLFYLSCYRTRIFILLCLGTSGSIPLKGFAILTVISPNRKINRYYHDGYRNTITHQKPFLQPRHTNTEQGLPQFASSWIMRYKHNLTSPGLVSFV